MDIERQNFMKECEKEALNKVKAEVISLCQETLELNKTVGNFGKTTDDNCNVTPIKTV